jgi:hypothetical protein
VISNVSYQGLEELNPVLHFEGLFRRMVLSRDHVLSLVQITGSVIFSDWIGSSVVLTPGGGIGEETIQIQPVPERKNGWFRANLPTHDFDHNGWLLSILVVLGLAVVSLAYVWHNSDELWNIMMSLLG